MSNFDDIFEPAQQSDFDKEAWAAKKKAERDDIYDLADATAEEVCTDSENSVNTLMCRRIFATIPLPTLF